MQKVGQRNKNDELKELAQLERDSIFNELGTHFTGLTEETAADRLEEYGPNVVASDKLTPWYVILWHSASNPFALVLAFLALVSALTGSIEAAIYMCLMIVLSVGVSFTQEYRSEKASDALREMIENTTNVKRDGEFHEIPMDEVVPGDIIRLTTGDMIPADAVLLESKDLFINQASLTGESYPVEKRMPEDLDEQVVWSEISSLDAPNILFMGTDVLSGTGEIVIAKTGTQTMFGDIAAKSTASARVASNFDKGINRVSRLLMTMVLIMFPIVFLINFFVKGSALDSFLFAISVAVGLTPEMLPMIVNTNLAKGAVALSREKVIIKELSAIQNLGSMDILCTDKTGTITEDRVVMMEYRNARGTKSNKVLNAAYLNSNFQTGWKNLMDIAVINYFQGNEKQLPYQNVEKVDEIPFDFSRRRLSVVVKLTDDGLAADNTTQLMSDLPDMQSLDQNLMVTKGAVEEMQEICTRVVENGVLVPITADKMEQMRAVSHEMNMQGMRALAVAERVISDEELEDFDVTSERDMVLIGFIGFLDPAKESAKTAIASLHDNGITVKVLTGDNAIVAKKVCQDVGIPVEKYYLGTDIDEMSDEELFDAAIEAHLFAKLSPMQKSRVITMLRKVHTVGFMGDGINDAPSLRAADVGISVDTAADITKDASSIILLEKSLQVLETGVIEGRKVFTNMMKYIRITLSSNFGNVFSILVASWALPFFPMLPTQLLTLNLIYDISQLTVPWDNVDAEELKKPVKWETRGLARFAVQIGPLSSIFDITTFAVLWFVFGYSTVHFSPNFQAGWFIESLATQTLAFHILRTKKIPFMQSHASLPVYIASIGAFVTGALLMFTPLGSILGMGRPAPLFYAWWLGIVIVYMAVLQTGKTLFYARERRRNA